jgi:hypothetical protein
MAPVAMVGGIPLAYVFLFGGSTIIGTLSAHANTISHKVHSRYYNWKYYWRRFSYSQNQNSCMALMAWLFTYQHQFKGKNCISFTFEHLGLKYEYKMPKPNQNMRIKTAHGYINIRVLSFDGVNIGGFEVSVNKRPWGWFRQSRINLLDWFIRERLSQFSIKSSDETETLQTPPVIYTGNNVVPRLPKEYLERLKNQNVNIEQQKAQEIENKQRKHKNITKNHSLPDYNEHENYTLIQPQKVARPQNVVSPLAPSPLASLPSAPSSDKTPTLRKRRIIKKKQTQPQSKNGYVKIENNGQDFNDE